MEAYVYLVGFILFACQHGAEIGIINSILRRRNWGLEK